MRLSLAYIRHLIPLVSAGCAGLAAGVFLQPDVFAGVTQELIAFFGLLMAAVLPAMTLTATGLRSGNLSRKRLESLYIALQLQMKVWFSMFVIALMICALVVLGKIVDWKLLVIVPGMQGEAVNLARILNTVITSGVILFVLRVGAIGRGVLSLLSLSREVALSEAAELQEERNRKLQATVSEIQGQPGRGNYVDLPH